MGIENLTPVLLFMTLLTQSTFTLIELSHLLNETQHIFLSWLTFREFLWFLVNDSTLLSGPFDDHLTFIKAKIQQQYVFVAPVSYIS